MHFFRVIYSLLASFSTTKEVNVTKEKEEETAFTTPPPKFLNALPSSEVSLGHFSPIQLCDWTPGVFPFVSVQSSARQLFKSALIDRKDINCLVPRDKSEI